MTTDAVVEGAAAGAAPQPVIGQDGAGQPGVEPTVAPATPLPALAFTAEQQAHIDKLIGDRLRRDRVKWQQDAEAKAKAEAEAAEAERQKAQGEWEALARKHEATAAEAKTQVGELSARLERADAVIAGLVDSRKAGLPEAMLKALEGRDIYDQLQLVDAFAASLPAQPAAGARQPTQPTPPQQGKHELTAEERRRQARSSW